jgi:hypothetical protein
MRDLLPFFHAKFRSFSIYWDMVFIFGIWSQNQFVTVFAFHNKSESRANA